MLVENNWVYNQEQLKLALQSGLNVVMEGVAGTGKTSCGKIACDVECMKMVYYSASTLDPFVDIVGLPKPVDKSDGSKDLEFYRTNTMQEANVLFFDEANRAQSKTTNAMLEIMQFGTVNGEELPELHSVIIAINPNDDEYDVVELDPAFKGRFHMHLYFEPVPDHEWFKLTFGGLGMHLYDWWSACLDDKQKENVSPRRLEYIGKVIRAGCDINTSVARDILLPFDELLSRINNQAKQYSVEDFINNKAEMRDNIKIEFDVAYRFAFLLPTMKPAQIIKVYELILELPPELLAQLSNAGVRKVVKRAVTKLSKTKANDLDTAWLEKQL